jgi:hypothetical protein
MSSQSEPTFDELSRELDKRVGGADKVRADELTQLAETRRAKEAGMKREQARLTKKYGPDHPRVAAITNRLAVNASLTRDLNLEATRVRADIPRVNATGWAVHGHVRDKDLKPVGGLTVALYDSKARWVEAMGYACTRSDGYYRIETKQVGATDGPFFLRVLSGNATHLYSDQTPLTPVGGAIDSREVVLGSAVCAPPVTSPNDPVPGPDAGPVGGPGVQSGGWAVRGRVTNEEGQGLGGLVVSLYDRDLFFDDRLGQTETDANGYYSFNYRTEDFRDLIERKPDIYLKVLDKQGRTLYTSKRKVRYESGRVEIINAQVD